MKSVGFIGAGNMAEAIIKGLLISKKISKGNIFTSDINHERLKALSSDYGVKAASDNKEIVANSDIIFLAVKPGVIHEVLGDIKNLALSKKIFISIAAGISTSYIKKQIGKKISLVRVMPNASSIVLEGASAVYFDSDFSPDNKKSVLDLLESFGVAYEIDKEYLMDAVTGLSGSGPAFVSVFVESLADGGVKMGLSRELSLKLALQTVYGTSKLMIETMKHPAEVKDMVSSPGGTTISGIHKLEEKGFRDAVISAVESASTRSAKLSEEE